MNTSYHLLLKHKINEFSVLNNKLLTIAPTSQFKDVAASFAVLAELPKIITLNFLSNSFNAFSNSFNWFLI